MKTFFVGAFVVLALGLAALVTAALTIHRHDAEHEARLDRMRAGLMQAPEGAYREWLDRYRVSRQEERRALEALVEADARLRALVTPEVIRAVAALVPDDWVVGSASSPAPTQQDYGDYLIKRLETPRAFVEEAIRARSLLV